ncbi:MAG: hypothetical protein A2017_07535 [Lentisphaerae bacterium GWF2_44_16]|nr:MAG: hypothetical protein A2017_07535 [Lentisphaerae bacterium GWF2_44_16]
MTVSVFDITVCDWNTGNRIIAESVYEVLYNLFPSHVLISLPYWEPFTPMTLDYVRESDYVFFGGGNHLSSRLENFFWGVTEENYRSVRNVLLLGLGWWKYEGRVEENAERVLRHTLHPGLLHSVRDSYAKEKLSSIGIDNVLVTGCPSMWGLTPEHCESIEKDKSDSVLFTFSSDYAPDMKRDSQILQTLKKNYEKLYFWPQGPADCGYIRKFDFSGTVLPANLPALDNYLENTRTDYIGTRLHAGIKAMQHSRRSIIVAIDNRAAEKGKDFNLPVVSSEKLEKIDGKINSSWRTKLKIPLDNIEKWKRQFKQ